MPRRSYLTAAATAPIPQSAPLDERQVTNSAGGFAYPVDCWTRLERFLILGSEGGSYYAGEQKLTTENIDGVKEAIQADGQRAVKVIADVSQKGRAPKNDPAIFALALAASHADHATRTAALRALPSVCRTGTHLLHFVDFIDSGKLRGWGRSLRSAIGDWYTRREAVYQCVKYRQRDGWSHRDVLRLCHIKPAAIGPLGAWIVKGEIAGEGSENLFEAFPIVEGYEKARQETDPKAMAKLIATYGLTREMVPTELLGEAVVLEALLYGKPITDVSDLPSVFQIASVEEAARSGMPLTALIRNLGNLSKAGVMTPLSDASKYVCDRLADKAALKRARVHPIQILTALLTYKAGRGVRGSGEWTPVPAVLKALDAAFYDAFDAVEPSGKRFYLGVDISGSMDYCGEVAGVPGFSPRMAAAAMAMVIDRTEPQCYARGFGTTLVDLDLSGSLDAVMERMRRIPMGGTDCALPMIDAERRKLNADCFVVLTDSETWYGNVHPAKALVCYRAASKTPAKLAVMAMVPNRFSIADPTDGGMMDFVGFDTAAPALLSDFARHTP